jgi:hypothetical protein
MRFLLTAGSTGLAALSFRSCVQFPSYGAFVGGDEGAISLPGRTVPSDGGDVREVREVGDAGDVVDGGFFGLDAGCPGSTATTLLGGAQDRGGFIDLTTEDVGLAGGVASPTLRNLDAFRVSFEYSITYAKTFPAAGLALFVRDGDLGALQCQTGPDICALGTSTPGWAVLLRIAKGGPSDPNVPFVAIVDAERFPGTQPTSPVSIDPALAWSKVGSTALAEPPATTWHLLRVTRASGGVTVDLDGVTVLSDATPNAGTLGTWGIGASTGASAGASRIAVRNITFECR